MTSNRSGTWGALLILGALALAFFAAVAAVLPAAVPADGHPVWRDAPEAAPAGEALGEPARERGQAP